MWNRLLKWMIYSIGFAAISTPIHLQLNCSEWTWVTTSLIIGFFAGLLNEILSQLKKLNDDDS